MNNEELIRGKQFYSDELEQLKTKGWYVMKNAFTPEEIKSIRDNMEKYYYYLVTRDKDNWMDKTVGGVIVNSINLDEFEADYIIFKNKRFINFLRILCDGDLNYAHWYDIRSHSAAPEMHHDGAMRHLSWRYNVNSGELANYLEKKYDIGFEELVNTPDWWQYRDTVGADFNSKTPVRGLEIEVYRIALYLEGHVPKNKGGTSGGLSILEESHHKPRIDCKQVEPELNLGDVLIFDSRVYHAGIPWEDPETNGRGLITTAFGKNNWFNNLSVEGSISRMMGQTGNLRKDRIKELPEGESSESCSDYNAYKLNPKFKKVLEDMDIGYEIPNKDGSNYEYSLEKIKSELKKKGIMNNE